MDKKSDGEALLPMHTAGKRKTNETYWVVLVTVTNFVSYSTWTLLNKAQYTKFDLTFTILPTSLQMLYVGALSWLLLALQGQTPRTNRDTLVHRIGPLGLVRSADIGFGNAALRLVTVPLQQVLKSTIPVHVCVLKRLLGTPISTMVWLSLIPIVGGVALAVGQASGGETVVVGVVLALISCFARAGKAILNERLLSAGTAREKLSTLTIMALESPTSGCILLVAGILVEGSLMMQWQGNLLAVVAYNAVCALCMFLNQWSYISIIQHTSSVTCQILMNVKMIVLIVTSSVLLQTPLSFVQIVGMIIATTGCIGYAMIKQRESSK